MSLRHNAADVIQSLNDYFNNEPIVHFNRYVSPYDNTS